MRELDTAEYWQEFFAEMRLCDTPGCRMFCLRGWTICRDCRDREIARLERRAAVIRERMRRAWDRAGEWLEAGAERADRAAGYLLEERRCNRITWAVLIYAALVFGGYILRWMMDR